VTHGGPINELMLKRERLLALCAAQRDDLAALTQPLAGPLQLADRAIAGVRYLRDHPLVLGAAVAVLAVVRPRGTWKWAKRGFAAWRVYRALGRLTLKSAP
jgi:hypothetical protein